MDKNPFLKRLIKEQTRDVVHSSAYAKAQNNGGLGVASTESFADRREIDSKREYVRKYRESRVMNDPAREVLKAKRRETSKAEIGDGLSNGNTGAVQDFGAVRSFETSRSVTGASQAQRGATSSSFTQAQKSSVSSRFSPTSSQVSHSLTSRPQASRPQASRPQVSHPLAGMSHPPARRNPGISR